MICGSSDSTWLKSGFAVDVDHEVILDHEFRVHAGLALGHGMLEVGIGGVASIERAKAAHQAVGNHFDAVTGGNSFQAVEGRSLAEAAFDLVGNVRPEGVLGLAHDAAIQDDSPLLLLGRRKAQALEGNRHPHDEAVFGYLAA